MQIAFSANISEKAILIKLGGMQIENSGFEWKPTSKRKYEKTC